MNNNIFIAFDNRKIAVSIAKILISNGDNVVAIAKNSTELMNSLNYYAGGIIITGCVFDGVRLGRLIEEVSEEFNFIAVGNKAQLDDLPDDRIFKLSTPMQKNDLVCSVEMLLTMDTEYKPTTRKNVSEEKIIQRAKSVLIDMYSMTEDQAHRYMQKKSMDTGRKMVDIARIILDV